MGGFKRHNTAGNGEGEAGYRGLGAAHNEVLNTVVIVPTSSIAPEIWPLRLAIGSFAGKESFAVIPGIRQVRKGRLRGALGVLSHDALASLDECLDAYLR